MISTPEDYGLSEQETLAFRCEAAPPEAFQPYWSAWRDELAALPTTPLEITDDARTTMIFRSMNEVRVVGRLTRPSGPLRGAVLTTHGYAAPGEIPGDDEPWSALGLATLRLRVRGYPPSIDDVPDLREQWILHNIHSPQSWILRGAVADVAQGYRVLRRLFGDEVPIALHGESFGAGLAVMAAAQLDALGDGPFRMAVGLPTFGAWRWRVDRYANGSGAHVNMMVDALRGDDRARLINQLELFDAALHARGVTCPCLCKLAMRDDVVPAPSAAAVYNALGSEWSWRFVTRYGHFDGGLADLRRHGWFERLHLQFVNPGLEPEKIMAEWEIPLEPESANAMTHKYQF